MSYLFEKKQEQLKQYSSLKVLQIILAMVEEDHETTIQQLSKKTLLNQSTIHRILQELVECNYVKKDEFRKKYSLGVELINLSTMIRSSNYLERIVQGSVERLRDFTGETVFFVMRDGEYIVYTCKADTKNQVAVRAMVGWKSPLYCTGAGKSILANMPAKWIEKYFQEIELKRYTDNTLITKEALAYELEQIRKDGVSYDRCEFRTDVNCIAAPVFSSSGEILGAVSISAPSYRFSIERATGYKAELLKCTRNIEERLNGHIYY